MTEPEERLRRALTTEVAEVEVPPHALGDIRARIAARRRRWSWRFGTLGIPVIATAAAVAVGVATCAPPRRDAAPPPAAPASTAPAPSPAGPTATESIGAVPREVRIPVYYLGGSGPRGPLLYREYRLTVLAADTPAARTRAAVSAMLIPGSNVDPDYITRWPAGVSVRDARVDGNTVSVDLSWLPASGDGRWVDQLVYTATAASDAATVRLLVDGRPVTRLWGVDTTARRPAVDVQAPLWLIEPGHGTTVSRPLAIHVAGIVFEATARLRVRDAGGAVVAERTLTLSNGAPQLGEVRTDVALPAGRYTVEVFAISPADGSEQFADDHDVTVR